MIYDCDKNAANDYILLCYQPEYINDDIRTVYEADVFKMT
jgi:hypothetical protein